MNRLLRLTATAFVFVFALNASAEVKLPQLLGDHVVLQRGVPIHIWGWADPGEQVSVSFRNQRQATTTGDLGKWDIYLQPEAAGGPDTLTVKAANTVTISDVLVGDVWFASGQSNMEMPLKGFTGSSPLKNSAEEIASANQPQIRLLRVHSHTSDHPLPDLQGADEVWTACTPETAADFSAAAYFFGREIQQDQKVPIGLIDVTKGGTPIEAWISLDGLSADPSLMPVFQVWSEMANMTADVPAIIARDQREDEAARAANMPPRKHPWHPEPASWDPAYLYNAMVAPFIQFPIKGVIWYQGEANSLRDRAPMYGQLLPALIADWRKKWRQGNFPFLYVQISSFTSTDAEVWGTIRDAQRRALSVANTGMAVSLDVGDPGNVHPPDKQTVGHRLALAARDIVYGEHVEDSGPLYRQAFPEGPSIRVIFDHADGLTAEGGPPVGFEVAAADHKFVPATAKLDGQAIVAAAAAVKAPVYVRYAWANAPEANLYNAAALPASTFTSEDPPDPPANR